MSKKIYSVRGTSCKSCEVVIERELKKNQSVESVNVSHSKGTLTINTKGNDLGKDEINRVLQGHGYSVTDRPSKNTPSKKPIDWVNVVIAGVFIVFLYVLLDKVGLLRLTPSSAAPASMLGVIAIGFIASLSSCTAVVGGLVAAVSSAVSKDQENLSSKERFYPHLLFNAGRVIGFFVLGAIVGLIGSALQLTPTLNGLFVLLVAVLMIIIGINLAEIFGAPIVSMPKWLAHKVHDLAESKNPLAPVLLGTATFFLPCGFTQAMQLYALTLQNPLQSGLVMMFFALGTTPVLLGIGGAVSYANGNTLKRITQFAGVLVLILGISNAVNGAALLGVTSQTLFGAGNQTDSQIEILIENGRQQIEMDMTSRGVYDPDVLVVQEGIPVDWTINGDDFMGCGDTLVMPAFGINTSLQTGPNLVQFTPDKAGRFTFSCSMGMIRGTMIVTSAN